MQQALQIFTSAIFSYVSQPILISCRSKSYTKITVRPRQSQLCVLMVSPLILMSHLASFLLYGLGKLRRTSLSQSLGSCSVILERRTDPRQSTDIARTPLCPLCRLKPDLNQNVDFLFHLTFGHSHVPYGLYLASAPYSRAYLPRQMISQPSRLILEGNYPYDGGRNGWSATNILMEVASQMKVDT